MWIRNALVAGVLLFVGATAMLAIVLVVPEWLEQTRQFLHLESAEKKPEEKKEAANDDEIVLSETAKKNLNLALESVQSQAEYVRSIAVPGVVVERPGNFERAITAPLAGIVKQIHATPHDRVAPGKPLFTMQIISEPLETAQAGYYKTKRELVMVKFQLKQMEPAIKQGAIPQSKIIELEQQIQRLDTSLDALQHELKMRGLTDAQIARAGAGTFLKEVIIFAPEPLPNHDAEHGIVSTNGGSEGKPAFFYEMEDLKTLVGDHVQAGQTLCRLADHKTLFIEGRAFAAEAALLQRLAKEGLAVQAEFAGETALVVEKLPLRFFANKVDPDTQTLTFYVFLPNAAEELIQGSKTYHLWQYRPGQRVRLNVPADIIKNVIVVPAEAVVREGPETFVFRRGSAERMVNGEKKEVEILERYAVNVLHEDNREVVLAHDRKLIGRRIAMNAAVQLNWVLKAQKAGGGADAD